MTNGLTIMKTLVTHCQATLHPHAMAVAADAMFEVTRTPSVILQGPVRVEHAKRRCPAWQLTPYPDTLRYEAKRLPRYYHLDIDIIVTVAHVAELFDF